MTRLQDNGFSVNLRKCEWAVQETDFLGYWLTPTRLKPWRKKIDAILWLHHPRTVKDLRSFIGAVTYYRTMFPKCAHILAPLTALTSQKSGNVAWSAECQHVSKLSRRFRPRMCFFAIPTTTNHSMSILTLATSSYVPSSSKTSDQLPSIVASSMLHNATIPPWRKNSFPSSKPSKSSAQCCLVVVNFTCGPIIRI